MFFRLLMESFRRQRRRKMLAGIAILLGTTAVTGMLALATTIGDRIHKELAVYGANIIVYPKADQLEVKVGGVDIKPSSSGAYLKESDLEKLKTIFWANNLTAISPELSFQGKLAGSVDRSFVPAQIVGYRFFRNASIRQETLSLHSWWKLNGKWPQGGTADASEVVLGSKLAASLGASIGSDVYLKKKDGSDQPFAQDHETRPRTLVVVGIVNTGDASDGAALMDLEDVQDFLGLPGAVSRAEISARTKPEDAFARKDPDTLSPQQHEIWYCRPYANSIAYQIREAIPGAQAEQVRRVEQSEGNVLNRISGLMWLISAAALLAAGFAVSAAMATAILERRGEIGLMRSLGASKGAIALLFYAETGLLAIFAGTLGYLAGSGLAAWLGSSIFHGDGGGTESIFIPILLPVVVALALSVAIAGSTPSIRTALRMQPSAILREDA